MLALWHHLRNGRHLPARRDVQPRLIGKHLPDVFILEFAQAEAPKFRLAGTRICSYYGFELRGTKFISLWHQQSRPALNRFFQNLPDREMPVHLDLQAISLTQRSNQFEMLLLPLQSEASRHFLLGAAFAVETGFWLGADPILHNRLEHIHRLSPEAQPAEVKQHQHRGIAAAALIAPSAPDWSNRTITAPIRRLGHLKLFKGGKV